jgi:TolB protein
VQPKSAHHSSTSHAHKTSRTNGRATHTSKSHGSASHTSHSHSSQKKGTGTLVKQTTTRPTINVSAPTAAAPLAASPTGSQLAASEIPWSAVGAGWTVTIWNPVPLVHGGQRSSAPDELLLVDPAGHAYAEDTFPAYEWTIADWSGDKTRVVMTHYNNSRSSSVVVVNLLNGETISSFDVAKLESVSFTHPDGTGLLIEASHTENLSVLARTDLYGQVGLTFSNLVGSTYPGLGGSAVYTPDGTELVLAAKGGLDVVSNLGALVAHLPVKGALNCYPISWWLPGQVTAACYGAKSSTDYAISLSGAAPVVIGPAMGVGYDDSVVAVGGSVFSNMGACSAIVLVKLVKGQWQGESIPGAVSGSSQIIVGSYGDSLEVQATPSCGTRQLQQPSLFWYHPITNTSTLFFGSTHDGGVVADALGFPTYAASPNASIG